MNTTPRVEAGYAVAEAQVMSEYGIHARPSALIAMKCSKYEGKVIITRISPPPDSSDPDHNAHSIMDLMTLEAARDNIVRIMVQGTDAKAVDMCQQLVDLISSDLDNMIKAYEGETGRKWVVR
ncbi:MAG: hypothetical protein C0404_11385 [Verrucomicrobia bacterium]|nr:hypothetical protein [Verrucomicrobiota bacterium]